MTLNLYPCPFCGAAPRAGFVQQYGKLQPVPNPVPMQSGVTTSISTVSAEFFRVWCDNTRECKVMPRVEALTVEQIQCAWNYRHRPAGFHIHAVPAPLYAELANRETA